MATSNKMLNDTLRNKYLEIIKNTLKELGEEVIITNSNEIAIPCVDSEGNDKYCCFTVKVPTGSRDGEPYDAYANAQEYEMKLKDKAEKAEKAKIAKEKKMARDAQIRAKKGTTN